MFNKNILYILLLLFIFSCEDDEETNAACSNIGESGIGQSCNTSGPRSRPLLIASSYPQSGAINVAVDGQFSVTFNTDVDPESIIANSAFSELDTIKVYPKDSPHIKLLVDAYASGNEIIIQPKFDLISDKELVIEFTEEILSAQGGRSISGNNKIEFKTSEIKGSNPGYLGRLSWNQSSGFPEDYVIKVKYGRYSSKTEMDSSTNKYIVGRNSASEFEQSIKKSDLYGEGFSGKMSINRPLTPGMKWYFSMQACHTDSSECSDFSDEVDTYVEY